MNMNRKSIFITGAAAGIGRSTALLFAKNDWFVGLFDVDEEALISLHEQIGEHNSCFHVVDVTDPESVQAAANAFSEQTGGRMHVLFNNAGILRMGHFEDVPLAVHRKTVDVNINGILNCIHTCLPILKQTTDSHIINMSSASAFFGIPELSSYSATKFAVRSLTESLNIEFERHGIVVCDIAPGYVKTPMITNQEHKAASIDKVGLRLAPEDVADEVWKAAHGKKVHRYMGFLVTVSPLLSPFTNVMKFVTKRMT
jgi:NADP-dependent 3-hydroxy acid dehydrogenase YdfG